jgi:hypothetical protein
MCNNINVLGVKKRHIFRQPTEIAGLYILLAAGTNVLPHNIRATPRHWNGASGRKGGHGLQLPADFG